MQTIEDPTDNLDTASGRLYNFSAGPGALPTEVMLEVKSELPTYRDLGTSVMEISHRSPTYTEIAASARNHLRSLLGLGEEWHILFLQGGASMQFHQVPLNFLSASQKADYLVTGAWSVKALKEAKRIGQAHVAASGEDKQFSYIPDASSWDLSPDSAYLHFTSNNTIYGTQFHSEPDVEAPLICDVSSDFLSRPLSMDRYGLLYAGAQKNVGPAGVTIVLVRDDFLARRKSDLPTMLDYGTHTAKLFNTPPVFAVYIVEKVLRWLSNLGGLTAIERINSRKAARLYGAIDASDFYRGTAHTDSRSLMNVTFRIADTALEPTFLKEARDAGMLALKGHRSVGGIRASIYNACPETSVDALVDFMQNFEESHG